jgi:glutathione transport system substrate-binding protein
MTEIRRRSLLGGAAAIAAAPAIIGRAAAQAQAKGDLVVAVPDNLVTLDPANANNTLDQGIARLMLEGLFTFDQNMKTVPLLAESATANDKATEFTFKLRQGVKFHDGTPFDAEAVKFNLERIANPENHLIRQSLLAMLDHVEAVDQYTAKVVLKTPFGAFMNTIAHPALPMQSPAALKKYGKDISRNPVGTGPFTFTSWTPDTVKVARNPNYWRQGWPKVNSVTVRSVPENGARMAMLSAGEAHYVSVLPPEMVKVVQANAKLELINTPSIITRYVSLNTMKKPFNDIRVRQALNYAVDKEAFIKVVWSGYADMMDSPEPPQLTFYQKQSPAPWPHDVAKAKQLLAEAGYPNGFEMELWGSTSTVTTRGMQFVQQQFAQVGVKLTVSPMEAGVLNSKIFSVSKPEDAQVQAYYAGWSASTGDADWQFRPLFSSMGFPPSLFNVSYYKSDAVDNDVKDALLTADPSIRGKAYADAQKRVWEDVPAVWLSVDHILDAKAKNLTGAFRIPDGGFQLGGAEFT